jgi:hypothetical protein
MANHERWAFSTRTAHGVPCAHCGARTFAKAGVCVACKKRGRMYVDPVRLPEDYLVRCAEELLRRREERDRLLVKLGIKPAPEAPREAA